jgi:hypothetical protein
MAPELVKNDFWRLVILLSSLLVVGCDEIGPGVFGTSSSPSPSSGTEYYQAWCSKHDWTGKPWNGDAFYTAVDPHAKEDAQKQIDDHKKSFPTHDVGMYHFPMP